MSVDTGSLVGVDQALESCSWPSIIHEQIADLPQDGGLLQCFHAPPTCKGVPSQPIRMFFNIVSLQRVDAGLSFLCMLLRLLAWTRVFSSLSLYISSLVNENQQCLVFHLRNNLDAWISPKQSLKHGALFSQPGPDRQPLLSGFREASIACLSFPGRSMLISHDIPRE